jgi:glycosyltransferase involved in cell wall biosynthesis
MNIWFVSAYDQPRGQSTRTYDFSRQLVERGHQVTIFTNSFCHFTQTERLEARERWRVDWLDGIRIVWLKARPFAGNGLARGLNMIDNVRCILSTEGKLGDTPDVVIGPSVPILTGWAAWKLAARHKVPFVYEIRDVWPEALVDNGGLSRRSPVYLAFRAIEKFLYRRASAISSTLPCVHDHVAKSGACAGKVVYIPNGVDVAPFLQSKAYSGGDSNNIVVMYIGGFGLDHDVPSLIRAAGKLKNDARFRFVVIGSGERKRHCEALAASLGLENLEFRNPILKSSLPIAQESADVLVAAITNSKSFRFGLNLNKLCAYFASGRPVLFSGNPPNNPVVEAMAGISVDAEDVDAIACALRDIADMRPEDRAAMGMRGRAYAASTLGIVALAGRMEGVLLSVISGGIDGSNDKSRSVNY